MPWWPMRHHCAKPLLLRADLSFSSNMENLASSMLILGVSMKNFRWQKLRQDTTRHGHHVLEAKGCYPRLSFEEMMFLCQEASYLAATRVEHLDQRLQRRSKSTQSSSNGTQANSRKIRFSKMFNLQTTAKHFKAIKTITRPQHEAIKTYEFTSKTSEPSYKQLSTEAARINLKLSSKLSQLRVWSIILLAAKCSKLKSLEQLKRFTKGSPSIARDQRKSAMLAGITNVFLLTCSKKMK